MDLSLPLKGLLIGLSVAAPVGPMGMLCIQRTIERGRLYGLISGLGIATADSLYGSIAGFGLTLIASFLVSQQMWIRLIGGIFLVYLGLKTWFSQPSKQVVSAKSGSIVGAYISTFFLTLTNPTTILSFIAIFAGVGLGGTDRSYIAAILLVLGIFLGSALWWVILSSGVSWLRLAFDERKLLWINRISGLIIVAFGVLALVSVWTLARL